jgi:hypothetical protein
MGPLGLLSSHPGVSYIFSGADASPEGGDASLWGIVSGSSHNGSTLGSSPSPWTVAMGDMFMKIDGKLKVYCSYVIHRGFDVFSSTENHFGG